MIKPTKLTAKYVRSILDYRPVTGEFIWKVRKGIIPIARPAGTILRQPHSQNEYRLVYIDNKSYRAHRLAWLYMTGKWPTNDIDHKNGNSLDNRWSNLREATNSQNAMNSRRRSDNTSGVTGVYWNTSANKWQAYITPEGKKTLYLGVFATLAAAKNARAEAANKYFGEFARSA